jgi:enolase-phosphatase E1
MSTKKISGILLDIEGTTSSIRFVYDVMFPYVRDHVAEFLAVEWESDSVNHCLPMLAEDVGQSIQTWLGDVDKTQQQARVCDSVFSLMDADVKATGLKQLQGLVWKNGFFGGDLVAHLYDDVAPAIKNWKAAGLDVRIYSSGSVSSQKLFFGHTIAGNLLDCFSGHYDTTTGPKREAASYQAIAADFGLPAEQILFVSDVVEELQAADSAGMQVVLSVRPGNKPVLADHGFETAETFVNII